MCSPIEGQPFTREGTLWTKTEIEIPDQLKTVVPCRRQRIENFHLVSVVLRGGKNGGTPQLITRGP